MLNHDNYGLWEKYNKTDTLHVASLGCQDFPRKMPHVSHVRKLVSRLFFIMAHAPNDKKSIFSNKDMLYFVAIFVLIVTNIKINVSKGYIKQKVPFFVEIICIYFLNFCLFEPLLTLFFDILIKGFD